MKRNRVAGAGLPPLAPPSAPGTGPSGHDGSQDPEQVIQTLQARQAELERTIESLRETIDQSQKKHPNMGSADPLPVPAIVHETELRYRSLFESSNDAIFTLDHQGRITDINQAGLEMLRFSREQLLGTPAQRLNPQEDLYGTIASFTAIMGECSFRFETRFFRSDGSPLEVEVSSYVVSKEPRVFLCIVRNITEARKADQERRRNLVALETLVRLSEMTGGKQDPSDFVLTEAERVTDSTVGRLYFVSESEGVMDVHPFSQSSAEGCQLVERPVQVPLPKTGLWAQAIKTRRPVMVQNYLAPHPHKGGLPLGHVDLRRVLIVPLIEKDRVVALMAVGNKPEEYSEADVRFLQLLIDGLWKFNRRRETEIQIRESLQEKEVLLREVHHRVKNNLAVVSSLLNLHAKQFSEPAVRAAFKEGQTRIRAMALIHDTLHRSDHLARVEMKGYFLRLAAVVRAALGPHAAQVAIEVDRVFLDPDRAIPCGLIFHELYSNAIRHAFAPNQEGNIRVSLARNDEVHTLQFSDDGRGLPPHFDIAATKTLGLQLVHLLARQLDGTVDIARDKGTAFRISFP